MPEIKIKPFNRNEMAFVLTIERTIEDASEGSKVDDKIISNTPPDYYVRFVVDSVSYEDRIIEDASDVPANFGKGRQSHAWKNIHFFSSQKKTFPVVIELHDDDSPGHGDDDDLCDINASGESKLNLVFDLSTGKFRPAKGVRISNGKYTSKGNGNDRATIVFSAKVVPLKK